MKVVLALLMVCALSLACTSKSTTAPTTTVMPTILQQDMFAKPDGASKDITILSGVATVEGLSIPHISIDLRGTAGMRMAAYNEDGNVYPCDDCVPGASLPVHGLMAGIFGTARLRGHDYQLNANWGPSYANLALTGGTVIVPPLTAASPALVSVPFTLGAESILAVSENDSTPTTHYPLMGRGTVTFTFTLFPSTPNVWWMTHAVYTFQK